MTSQEIRAARWVLGESEATRPELEKDPFVAAKAAEMVATVRALQAWGAAEMRHPRKRPRRGLVLKFACGAAAVLAVAILLLAESPRLEPDDVAWIGEVKDVPQYGKGAPSGEPGRGSSDAILGIPSSLPGGFSLARRTRVSEERTWLLYTGAGGKRLSAYLCDSPGPETDVQEVRLAGRVVLALRRSNVVVAFEGEGASAERCREWARRLFEMK